MSFLLYKESDTKWIYFTNNRVVVNQEGKPFEIWFEDIVGVRGVRGASLTHKRKMNKLIVSSRSNEIVLEVEAGGPYWGGYNVIGFIAIHNCNL